MDPKQTEVQQTNKKKSTGYIIAGVAALLLIIAALWSRSADEKVIGTEAQTSEKFTEEKKVLSNEIKLHKIFSRLQQLDEQYGSMLIAGSKPADLDNMKSKINASEVLLSRTLDSMEREANDYNGWANVVMLDSISGSFRTALTNRKYMTALRESVSGKPFTLNADQKVLLQMEKELDAAKEEVANLEKKLKNKVTEGGGASNLNSGKQLEIVKEKEALEISLREEEERSVGLLEITSNLKKENEALTAQLNNVKREGTTENAAMSTARTRMSKLEEEVQDLNAELSFARVDCSLSRADVKKIISNSRQRQELLADAMKTLQSLSVSDNSNVKQKARDKIRELNQIASAVRD